MLFFLGRLGVTVSDNLDATQLHLLPSQSGPSLPAVTSTDSRQEHDTLNRQEAASTRRR